MTNAISKAVVLMVTVLASAGAVHATMASRETYQSRKAEAITIARSGTKPSTNGPAEYFTGTARIAPLFDANEPSRANGASVTFEPGARTAWHTHPLGQTLIVTAGAGLAQRWDGPIEHIEAGHVIWFAPGEKHWHG